MRARNIKPGFFKNEELWELPPLTRILFAGLWCLADREGRLEDRPKRIKVEILPADKYNIDEGLQSLHDCGLIQRYSVDGAHYIQVTNFLKHQTPHVKENASTIPAPDKHQTNTSPAPPDSLIPDSLIPDTGLSESGNPQTEASPLLTDEEQSTLGQAYQSGMADIEKMALSMEMRFGEFDRITAERLMSEYTTEWVLEAMRRAATGPATARSWRYIEAILKRWKEKGGMDDGTRTMGGSAAGNTAKDTAGTPESFYAGLYVGEV